MFDIKRYPARISLSLDADTIAALKSVAEDANASVSSVARECIRRGLDPTREAWRKSKRRRGGTRTGIEGGTNAGQPPGQ